MTPSEAAGTQIGRYKLLQQIGEGGMGTIWMAEQREPVRRRVALKIIKLGMDTKQVIARFEAERQALAMMDHPHIAKVLDAGATETGRPYFVMEYIKGIPILEYCDQEKLDTKARLELFTSVCHAIQHAHQKGIIHRDIKPSNVLVTLHDGVPVPKVIDFGIAKATNSELTTKTLFTEHRQMIGTPAYMSPEQAEMSGLDIDTRSDVYSLGVLLYELLTGTTPFDMKTLLESGFDEMLRAIREVEPHKPSTRVSKLGDTGTRTAQQRRVELKKLSLLLRGDLDWIVMKCLEKDRTRRYETANGLASDLRRHLSDEPVTAGPPGSVYKLRKFVRRNRVQVITTSVVMAALLAGVVATSWGLVQTSRARLATVKLRLEDEKRSSVENARLSRNAEAVAALLGQCEESLRAGDASKAKVALDAARKRADEGGADQHAERLARLAADLDLLSEFEAIDQFKWTWAQDISGQPSNFGNPKVAATRDHAALRRYGADPEFVSVEDAVARVDASAIRGRIVLVMNWLFLREHDAKDRAEALREVLDRIDSDAFREAFREAVISHDEPKLVALARDPALLEQSPEFTAALGQTQVMAVERRRELMEMAAFRRPSDLALLMALQGSYEREQPDTANERIRWLQAALAADPQNFAAYINMASALTDASRLEEAIACDRRAIEIVPGSAQAYTNLGAVLERQAYTDNGTVLVNADKRDAAIDVYRKAIEHDPNYAYAHFNLGFLLSKQGKADEAIASYRRSIELDPNYARAHGTLAEEYWRNGRLEEAAGSFRKAIVLDSKWMAPCQRLGELLESLGRNDEAIECFRKAIARDPTSAYVHCRLGDLRRKKGQVDEAIALFRKAIELDPKYDAYGSLGVALNLKGQADEAIVLMRKSLELRPDYAAGMYTLSETLCAHGQSDEALSWARKAIELAPKDPGAHNALGMALESKGQSDEALACFRSAVELDPTIANNQHNVGATLVHSGRPAEAVAAYRKAAELDANNAQFHLDLALALQNSGQQDAALESLRRAVELDPTKFFAQYVLGCCLQEQCHWDEAIACYRKAIELAPDFAEAHCNLGACLQNKGRLAEALQCIQRGHELGSKRPDWPYPSAEWLREAEERAALEAKLPALLEGTVKPKDSAELIEYVTLCAVKKLHCAATKLTVDLFAAEPRLADDLGSKFRYNSAICAALAGTGHSDDAARLDDRERARLRKQAIDWLRADLALHAQKLKTGKPQERAETIARLREWQEDAELACIRDPEELDLLPDDDRAAFEELWLDVAEMSAGESR